MLTPYSRSKFVTKILTSATGEQFQVVFLVAIIDGKIQAQAVSAEPIAQASSVIFLPSISQKNPVTFAYATASAPAVSPFSHLFFFNSQPTRAPSL